MFNMKTRRKGHFLAGVQENDRFTDDFCDNPPNTDKKMRTQLKHDRAAERQSSVLI